MDTVQTLSSLPHGIPILITRRHIQLKCGNTLLVLHEMVTLWSVLVLLAAAAVTGSEDQCSGSTSRVEFTVTSMKNGTTHRDVAVSLLSEVPADSQEPQPVALKVVHWTQRSGGTETVAIDISTGSSILVENQQDSTSVKIVTSGITTTPAEVTTPSPTPALPTPGPDYRLIPGFGFYKLSSDDITWSEGRRLCESEGAQMVIFRSEREMEEVKKIWGHETMWIGVYRDNPGSEFITVTGSRPGESFNALWHIDRPDPTTGDCVIAYTFLSPPLLNIECYSESKVLCFMSS